MTRNLKALGLALVAAFAMTAVMASGAQALKVTVGSSPAWLTGKQVGEHRFTVHNNGPTLECATADFTATALKNGEEQVTVVPTYDNCKATIGLETLTATVTMNDCDYLFHGGTEVTSTTFDGVEVDLKCPVGKVVEVHIYKKAPHEPINELCTLTVAEQNNLKENQFHNEADGTSNDVTLTTEVTVNITRHGSLLCGKASNGALYEGVTTITAFEDKGGTISNGTVSGLVEGNQTSLTISK